jgi:hypothetical protein
MRAQIEWKVGVRQGLTEISKSLRVRAPQVPPNSYFKGAMIILQSTPTGV